MKNNCKTFTSGLALLLVLLLSGARTGICAEADRYVYSYMPSDSLFEEGRSFLLEKQRPDSALLAFSIVSDRYDNGMDSSDKLLCVRALNNVGFIYQYHYNDYIRAYGLYRRILELTDSTDCNQASVRANALINIGNIFYSYSSRDLSGESLDCARLAYRMALDNAVRGKAYQPMMTAFHALTLFSDYTKSPDVLMSLIELYKNLDVPADTPLKGFNDKRIEIFEAVSTKDYTKAYKLLQQLPDHIDTDVTPDLYVFNARRDLIEFLVWTGRYDEAASVTEEMIRCAGEKGNPLWEMNFHWVLASILDETGDSTGAASHRLRCYQLSDSIALANRLDMLQTERFASDIEMYSNEARRISEEKRRQGMWLVAAIIAVIIVSFTCFRFIAMHRRLKESYKALFERQQQQIGCDTKSGQNTADSSPKYPVNISEDELADMKRRIEQVMESSEEIYTPEFSLDALARLTDIRPRTLSGVLSELFGKNFYALLNFYRVGRACRYFNDTEHYGGYTIEAVSRLVGYKSRSSFVLAFKNVTGLKPSEYLKMARDNASE
ncbi:AraC family transcriptional regulator [uncultured Muribaculum sp.]|uniref:helix-turn-helix domain-containing protein n=1 Tax=uncultured Muribaculum sp. TaxID=1918613 RepID=UPI0025EC1185|nr:AraC family transcriptional regulator [uncultured Muribaculum sp.]